MTMAAKRVTGLSCLACLLLVGFRFVVVRDTLIASPFSQRESYAMASGEGHWSKPEDSCQPHQHIMFLKTSKCSSSTIQNILMRYGYKHNLTFALPSENIFLGNPERFRPDMIPPYLLPRGEKVDMFTVHTRLHVHQLMKVLHGDSTWITAVREPSALYESMFVFSEFNKYLGLKLDDYMQTPIEKLRELPRLGSFLGRNQMLWDFGYSDNMTTAEVRRAIEEIDSVFHLVLVTEYLDESLVLLRHLLCWSLDDIVAFARNARRKELKKPIDPQLRHTLRELNSADVLLYEHFLERHQRRVLRFGERRMAVEVTQLQTLRDKYMADCQTVKMAGNNPFTEFREFSGHVTAYVPTNTGNQDCVLLSLPESVYLDGFRIRQMERFGVSPAAMGGTKAIKSAASTSILFKNLLNNM